MEHAFISRETRHIHLQLPPQLGVGDTRKGNGYGARASQHPGQQQEARCTATTPDTTRRTGTRAPGEQQAAACP